jgi:hypothetical protein
MMLQIAFTLIYSNSLIITTMVALYNTFAATAKARKAINYYILDNSESYRIYKTDTKRYILPCKDKSCSFIIRA